MHITIKDHDPSKRYRILFNYGPIKKIITVPETMQMPIAYRKVNVPDGVEVSGCVCVMNGKEDFSDHKEFKFVVDKGDQFLFQNDAIAFNNALYKGD